MSFSSYLCQNRGAKNANLKWRENRISKNQTRTISKRRFLTLCLLTTLLSGTAGYLKSGDFVAPSQSVVQIITQQRLQSREITPQANKIQKRYKPMSFNPKQLRTQIRRILSDAADLTEKQLDSDNAVELLMLIAAQESKLGEYFEQVGGGGALGMYQIEVATAQDTTLWASRHRWAAMLLRKYRSNAPIDTDLRCNIAYQTVLVRLSLWRHTEPIPPAHDVVGLANYWKRYHNTYLGKGVVSDAVENYINLVQKRS